MIPRTLNCVKLAKATKVMNIQRMCMIPNFEWDSACLWHFLAQNSCKNHKHTKKISLWHLKLIKHATIWQSNACTRNPLKHGMNVNECELKTQRRGKRDLLGCWITSKLSRNEWWSMESLVEQKCVERIYGEVYVVGEKKRKNKGGERTIYICGESFSVCLGLLHSLLKVVQSPKNWLKSYVRALEFLAFYMAMLGSCRVLKVYPRACFPMCTRVYDFLLDHARG